MSYEFTLLGTTLDYKDDIIDVYGCNGCKMRFKGVPMAKCPYCSAKDRHHQEEGENGDL